MHKVIMSVSVMALLTLSACNTMHGFGQDVEKMGDLIKRAAN
jgi:predicted small secreted protein